MKDISKELNSLTHDLTKLKDKLGGFVGNVTFNYEEQELIRRVFKSIFQQLEHKRDREAAKAILNKTGWIDG